MRAINWVMVGIVALYSGAAFFGAVYLVAYWALTRWLREEKPDDWEPWMSLAVLPGPDNPAYWAEFIPDTHQAVNLGRVREE